MKLGRTISILALTVVSLALMAANTEDKSKTFKVTADTIEACSCPLFCECYFNASPANPHMCQFNNVYKFRQGSHWGDTDLSNVKVWLSGDLGGEWGKQKDMPTEWVTITFDKASSKEQREAVGKVLARVFPVKWKKMDTREDDIEWNDVGATKHAKMKSGKGEVTLAMWKGPDAKQNTSLKNVQYWGSTSNDGFMLAKSTHHFDGEGEAKFSHEDRNGFTIRWTVAGTI
jgi:hypothetical protein